MIRKTPRKIGIKGELPQFHKKHSTKTTADILPNGERPSPFPSKLLNKASRSVLTALIQHSAENSS